MVEPVQMVTRSDGRGPRTHRAGVETRRWVGARLLIVHHTPSPSVHALLEAARSGATDPAIGPIEVVVRAALHATVADVLEADGYLLGTPANLGSMSGALKHFFDTDLLPVPGGHAGAGPTACSSTATTTPPARSATSSAS